jgi:hypothetical protein
MTAKQREERQNIRQITGKKITLTQTNKKNSEKGKEENKDGKKREERGRVERKKKEKQREQSNGRKRWIKQGRGNEQTQQKNTIHTTANKTKEIRKTKRKQEG